MSIWNSVKTWFDDMRGKPRELSPEELVQRETEAAKDKRTLDALRSQEPRDIIRQAGQTRRP